MRILDLITNEINQNGYHFNKFTKNKIGVLYAVPNKSIPEDCLSCDGYVLRINDYKKLYSVIGSDFNNGEEKEGEFRIPDYNRTGRFLQPGSNVGARIESGLPNITSYLDCIQTYGGTASYKENGAIRLIRIAAGQGFWANVDNASVFNIDFNASRSSSVYGKSATVQPPSQVVSICIKYK